MQRIRLVVLVLLIVQLSWTNAASAMDCAKASTIIEHLICGDSSLHAQDAALSKLYFSTLKKLSGELHDALIEDQKIWIRSRPEACSSIACLKGRTSLRLTQITACFAGATPDPNANGVLCAVAAHSTCPEFTVSAAADVWAYPFLVARVDDVAAHTRKDSSEKSLCTSEGPDNPGTPKQGQNDYTMTIVGAGRDWIAAKEVEDAMYRGGAHPLHNETIQTYSATSGKQFPITTLLPALRHVAEADKFSAAMTGHLALPCCGSDDGKSSLEDLHLRGEDEGRQPLPDAWAIDDNGELTVFYQYYEIGSRTFIAHATISPKSYVDWIAPEYRSWFAAKR